MPYANFLEGKKLDSQACNIYAMLAIFRPFFLKSGRSIGDYVSNHARVMHESPGWCCLILGDDYPIIVTQQLLLVFFRSSIVLEWPLWLI